MTDRSNLFSMNADTWCCRTNAMVLNIFGQRTNIRFGHFFYYTIAKEQKWYYGQEKGITTQN